MALKVMITGIGGSIGVHIFAHIMHNTDWEVIGVDSFRHTGDFDRLTEVCTDHPEWPDRLEIVTHDLIAPFTKRDLNKLNDVDFIINLASISDVSFSVKYPVYTLRNNHEIMLTMLELARAIKPKAFLQFSTDEVYGSSGTDGAHEEWSTILPSNPYSASKAAQEALCIAYWRTYGMPLIITNTMNNFGEMQQSSKYPVIIQKALSKGEKVKVHAASDGQIGTRYYIHSRNVADAVLFILKSRPPYIHKPGLVDMPDRYNIVGDIKLNNLELAERISSIMGKELDYELVDFHSEQPGHDLHYGLDGGKLNALGWKPPVNFEDSMKNTIEWQTKHKEWIEDV